MNYLHHQIQDPEIPPGFLVRIQIQPMWRTPIHSPNSAIRITKQIKIIKRLISSHRLQKTELCQHSPSHYYARLMAYKSTVRVLEYQLQRLRHFVA